MKELVDAGALPRIRIEDADAKLEDANDEVILAHDLYGDLPDAGATETASSEMINAAQRRVDRQQARLVEARKLVDSGVVARSYVAPLEAELTARETTLDLAHLRARLMADRAAMSQQQPPPVPAPIEPPASDLFLPGMEHYEGDHGFVEARDLPSLEAAFEHAFNRSLPISAEGETQLHRAFGFDHRGRVDVAVAPDTPEGVWLRRYLQSQKIPYYAFAHAIPGKATAAHIHIGPGSTRLGYQLTSAVSRRSRTRTHTAD